MRPLRDVTTILGSLALAGTLALLSPGVRAVRADDAAPAESSLTADGPTCEAGPLSGEGEITGYLQEITGYLELIQRLQMEQISSSPDFTDGSEDFIVLNNRGYNYGPASIAPPSAVELENR